MLFRSVWPKLKGEDVFSPVLDFKEGYDQVEDKFIDIGKKLGFNTWETRKAYRKAVKQQHKFTNKLSEIGAKMLDYLQDNPDEKALVLFGRPYNAFVSEANMGIPHKFASRGEIIFPLDMLPLEWEDVPSSMY